MRRETLRDKQVVGVERDNIVLGKRQRDYKYCGKE